MLIDMTRAADFLQFITKFGQLVAPRLELAPFKPCAALYPKRLSKLAYAAPFPINVVNYLAYKYESNRQNLRQVTLLILQTGVG